MPPFTKQTNEPIYPKVLWNRPVVRSSAGRLLIVGGHRSDFSLVQAFYQLALAAGAGDCQVVLPQALQSLLAGAPDSHFAPSNPSGAFSRQAYPAIASLASSAQAVAIGANLSGSSEATILTETIITQLNSPLILMDDAITAVLHNPELIMKRPNCLVITSMQGLFKLAGAAGLALNFQSDIELSNKLRIIQTVQQAGQANYLVLGRDIIVAAEGQLSVTPLVSAMEFFAPAGWGAGSVFWMQNLNQPLAGLTTAAYVLAQARSQVSQGSGQPLLISELSQAIKAVLQAQN